MPICWYENRYVLEGTAVLQLLRQRYGAITYTVSKS